MSVSATLQQTDTSVAATKHATEHRSIPILREIRSPRFVFTTASTEPLRIEVRSKEIFDQLGYRDQKVDFLKEEVLIVGFMTKLAPGDEYEITQIDLDDSNVEFTTIIKTPEPFVMFHDSPDYPLNTIVIPKQEEPLPGFQTTLPVKGGFYTQGYYWHDGDTNIEYIKQEVEALGLNKVDERWWRKEESYTAVSYIRLAGMKFPRAVSYGTDFSEKHVFIGTPGGHFLDMGITLPVMTHQEAVEHLAESLIMPILNVSIEEAKDFADEHIKNHRLTQRKQWRRPKEFNEEQFRRANNLPMTSDYSIFRRADINDSYSRFTESSNQAHLRIRLPEVRFERKVGGIATYRVFIAEYGRMSIAIVNLEKPLTDDMLLEGFQRALNGFVDGKIDKSRFNPVFAYSDNDRIRPY
jgi:hypothetical protein